MLQLAYFKAKNQFFTFDFADVKADVSYVMSTFFKNNDQILKGNINRKIIKQQKQLILGLFNYQAWSSVKVVTIENHACELLRYYPKVHDTLRQLLAYLDNQRM